MDFFDVLEEKVVRKIFGKKELEIINKQLNGFDLSQSEKNRLSRDIRPKLKAVEFLSEYKEYFQLKKNDYNKRLIKEIVETIMSSKWKKEIKAILLFGSHVIKTNTWRSDVDICVIFNNMISDSNALDFKIEIMRKLPEKIDINVFNTLPDKLKYSIAKQNIFLYSYGKFNNKDLMKSVQKMKIDRIKDKLEYLTKYVDELKEITPSNFDDYKKNFRDRAACERYFEKIVECIIDICFLIIKEKKLETPKDETTSFDILVINNIIKKEIAENLKDIKKMRNFIAHRYGKIDDQWVFHAIKSRLVVDVDEFIRQVKRN